MAGEPGAGPGCWWAGVRPGSFAQVRGAVRALTGKPSGEPELWLRLGMPGLGDLILTRRGWGHDPGDVARRLAAKSEAGSERWLACRGRGRLNNARRGVFRLLPGEPGGGARGLAVKGRSRARSMTRAYGRGRKFIPAGGGAMVFRIGSRLGLFPGKPRVVREVLSASGRGKYSLWRSSLAQEASLVGTWPVLEIFAGVQGGSGTFLGTVGTGLGHPDGGMSLECSQRVEAACRSIF